MRLKQWLIRKLLKNVRIVQLTEEQEGSIMRKLNQIAKIKDWLELYKQAGYQLYSRTDDKRWLGQVDFITTLEVKMAEAQEQKPQATPADNGYQSTIEE